MKTSNFVDFRNINKFYNFISTYILRHLFLLCFNLLSVFIYKQLEKILLLKHSTKRGDLIFRDCFSFLKFLIIISL